MPTNRGYSHIFIECFLAWPPLQSLAANKEILLILGGENLFREVPVKFFKAAWEGLNQGVLDGVPPTGLQLQR